MSGEAQEAPRVQLLVSELSSTSKVDAWMEVCPQVEQIAADNNVPLEVLASLKRVAEACAGDAKALKYIESLAEGYAVAHDTTVAQMHMAAHDTIHVFGRPQGVRITEKRIVRRGEEVEVVDVALKFKTVNIIWRVHKTAFKRLVEKYGVRGLAEKLTGWLIVEAQKRVVRDQKKKTTVVWWEACEKCVHPVSLSEDVETARRLVEELKGYDHPFLAAFAALLGLHPDVITEVDAYPVIVARALVALLGRYTQPTLHAVEMTLPGTGKSTTANILDVALGWLYYTEPPSPATLIGDARTGWSPLSGANGVWFDEFDGWAFVRQREDFKEVVLAMLSGMEQGRWKRSKGGRLAPEVQRRIPLYMAGNIDENGCVRYMYRGQEHAVCFQGAREFVRYVIRQVLPSKAEAFNERVAIAILHLKPSLRSAIQENTIYRREGRRMYGKPSVLRGLARLVRDEYAAQYLRVRREMELGRVFDNPRLQARYEAVATALAVLLGEPGEPLATKEVAEFARRLVNGLVVK